ncbi:MAG TPA: DinB family protein [Phycisphaerae bacterium]|nr:DinB family protein [Phycisphaerae bacterium]
MLEATIATINLTRNATLKLVADLNDDQIVLQPAPKTNHPAWVLGHLLLVDCNFLKLLDGTPPDLDANWKDIYGGGSTPVADKSKYKLKQFYLDNLAVVRGQIIERLKAAKPEDLAKPHPDPARRERFPTIGHMVLMYGTWHEGYHAGQLSTWRRVQGLPAV